MTKLTEKEVTSQEDFLLRGVLHDEEMEEIVHARTSLLSFTAYTMRDFIVNWHHRILCAYLDAFAMGRIKRLMVFMPPRHGKSEIISRRFPAYMLGRNPDAAIVLASYAASLASAMNIDVQTNMESEAYRAIFPESRIWQKGMDVPGRQPKRTNEYFEMVGRKGSLKTVGVGGGLSGFGFDRGIIDDPIKNREEADSETTREAIWQWYTSVFNTRHNTEDAGVCVLHTRWHEDDPSGRILAQMEAGITNDKWKILNLPALSTEESLDTRYDMRKELDIPLWPDRYGIDYLLNQKNTNSRDWAALFQQTPFTEGGMIIKKHWWKFWDVLPKFHQTLISVDCTFKGNENNDYVSIQTWGRHGTDKYLIDQVTEKMDFIETCNAVIAMRSKHKRARMVLIEDKANGPALISALKNRVSGLVPFDPKTSKEARVHSITPQIEGGNVYLPNPEGCDWVTTFMDQCAKFPNAKHDDMVDAMSQALIKFEDSEGYNLQALSKW